MRLVRWLGWSVGLLFLAGTLLRLVDYFNLFTSPPNLPETLNMVERRLAVQGYRLTIWPIFGLSNLAIGVGFMTAGALGLELSGRVARSRPIWLAIVVGLGMAGILGAVAHLMIIGAAQPTIESAYCDCGFKETEIVSQIWAQQLIESAGHWLENAALVLGAIGVAAVGTAFRDRMPPLWNVVSWLTAIGLLAAALIPFLGISEDVDFWVAMIVAGLIVPIWAIWLGTSFPARDEPESETL
jgi:hypothetical protein